MNARLFPTLVALVMLVGCGAPTVVDIDGNVYPVVAIGLQQWLGANLRVTRTPDGLPVVTHVPNDDSSMVRGMGLLYDWASARRTCMRGWHLPSDAEWDALARALGPDVGAALKDTAAWSPPNTGATNRAGFAARPSGYWNGGEFDNLFGRVAVYWSATKADTHFVWTRALAASHDSLRRAPQHPTFGLAVRCVRDG